MTTPSVPQDTLLMALWSTQLNSYVFVAVAALWAYDIMLRFQEEVAFIHKAKWNIAKLLYVSARYMPGLMTFFCIASTIVEDADCQALVNVAAASGMIILSVAESIFLLRTCVMWLVKSYIRYVMLILMAVFLISNSIIYLGQHKMIPDVPECNEFGQPLLWSTILGYLVLELAFIILTVVRCTKNRGSTREPLLVLLLKHNIFYYSCGFLFTIVNVLCMLRFQVDHAYDMFFFPIQITMHTILATRMQYQLWEADRARMCYESEQYPMSSLLCACPTEVTVAS
ncbi:hypothetical protein K503DRAFT_770643 [Rhizopogon vinicolor AM-OR11-026]|uniref:DUF6533 domain-containing protein n=1 Tax=Rhizopogon vinicolor AM-OR11-026 TaxID=1314800 RepID=A0A1B7N093_9AGAM|nr:hypothetical protein K503DRAFT_770643 [Rhizopogon vinicolor AM-OR11-026]